MIVHKQMRVRSMQAAVVMVTAGGREVVRRVTVVAEDERGEGEVRFEVSLDDLGEMSLGDPVEVTIRTRGR